MLLTLMSVCLPGLQAGVGWVEGVGIEHCPVGRGSDRLAVQFHLLLRIPQLQGAGALVGRRLLPIREGDGGGQFDEALGQVGVGGLEAIRGVGVLEALRLEGGLRLRLPLKVGRVCPSVWGPRVIHLVLCEG